MRCPGIHVPCVGGYVADPTGMPTEYKCARCAGSGEVSATSETISREPITDDSKLGRGRLICEVVTAVDLNESGSVRIAQWAEYAAREVEAQRRAEDKTPIYVHLDEGAYRAVADVAAIAFVNSNACRCCGHYPCARPGKPGSEDYP